MYLSPAGATLGTPPMPPRWPPRHHPTRTIGLAALHALDAEEEVLVPQVLQVRQDGVQLHAERGVLGGGCRGVGWDRGGSVLEGTMTAPGTPGGSGYGASGRHGEEEGGGCSGYGGGQHLLPLPSAYHRQMLCGPAQLEEAGDIAALGSVLPAPLGLCRGDSGGHSSSRGWLSPRGAPPAPRGHLTFQAVGVKLDVALAAAGGFHDHLDALPLDAGQGLGAGSGSCRQVPAGRCVPAEHPRPGLTPNLAQWGVADPNPLPFLGTNCDVTPTSKVAKTGEWSLVTMSSVQPGWWEGAAGGWSPNPRVPDSAGHPGLPPQPWGLTHRRSYRPRGSLGATSTGCGRTTRGH